jgi:hypothetical protein
VGLSLNLNLTTPTLVGFTFKYSLRCMVSGGLGGLPPVHI